MPSPSFLVLSDQIRVHSRLDALLEPAILAPGPRPRVQDALFGVRTRVRVRLRVADGSFEELLARFACLDTIVDAVGDVVAYRTSYCGYFNWN